jgi:ABC superfamily ATP binding cassette transporter, ABC protein
MFLEIKGLSKKYDKKIAVNTVDISLKEGKILCVLGPSGCGKSTILKMVGGFVKPDSGSIILDGKDITRLEAQDRQTATVFQSYGLFPNMNVLENVSYGLKFRYKDKKKIKEAALDMIERVGLKSYEKKPVTNLSGGEQQRVALARSLVIKPKLLLLDEPLSNLDAKLRVQMQEEIKSLQREFKITTIFVTHDQSEAFSLADEVVLMNKGEISQTGSPESLYNEPENEFALNFIGQANIIDKKYVRPEMICFSDKGKNALIKDIVFKGSFYELYLGTEDGLNLKMQVLNRKDEYKIGDTLRVEYKLEEIS